MQMNDNEIQIPDLTLEPTFEPAPVPVVVEAQPEIAEPELTAQEKQIIADFAQKIDVENTAQILQYGAGTQKKMADFSDAALENVRTQDLAEVGNLIADVVGELKGFDAEEEKGLFGFFRTLTCAHLLENLTPLHSVFGFGGEHRIAAVCRS